MSTTVERHKELMALRKKEEEERKKTAGGSSSSSTTTSTPVSNNNNNVPINVTITSYVMDAINSGKLKELMKEIIKESLKTTDYVFQGSQTPVSRYSIIMGLKGLMGTHLALFIAGTNKRGLNIIGFSKKRESSAERFRDLVRVMQIRDVKAGTGVHTVMAIRVALSNFFCYYKYEDNQPDKFEGVECPVAIPNMYQWMGSLGAMYVKEEETDSHNAKLLYCRLYDEYANWYIEQRANKAAERKKSVVTAEEIEYGRNRNRAWYPTQVSSFSLACRKAWSSGTFSEPTKGEMVDEAKFMRDLIILFDMKKDGREMTVDELMALKTDKSTRTERSARK